MFLYQQYKIYLWFVLVWFGLFVHPFSHICKFGHVNYRLQFTTQLIIYGHPHNEWKWSVLFAPHCIFITWNHILELLRETLDFERWCAVQCWNTGNQNSDQNIAGFKFLHNYSFVWDIYNTKTWTSNFLRPSLFWGIIQCWLITANQCCVAASHPRRVNVSFTPGWKLESCR
jgi:hypothetical protein